MTILCGLANCYPSKNDIHDSLEIHLIGAEYGECDCALTKFEEILHWFPVGLNLKIVLIGKYGLSLNHCINFM